MKGAGQSSPFRGGTTTQTDFLNKLASSYRILFKAQSVFPFEWFPSEIIITERYIHLIHHSFFGTQKDKTIPISAISTCSCSTGPMLGMLQLELVGEIDHKHKIENIWRADAIQAEKIITGLIIYHQSKIDLGSFSKNDFLSPTVKATPLQFS
jgi:hypothetical protein